jgi:hypothetical protein
VATLSQRPRSRRIQARLMRVINVPMRRLLGVPFPTPLGSRLMLVYLTGRRTGRHYRQPVSYVRHEDTLLTPGGGNWKLNLEEGQPVHIRLRGRDITARPELVSDLDQIETLLGVLVAKNPRSAAFIRIPRSPSGQFDRTALENAVRYGFRVVRWHPTDTDGARVIGVQTRTNPPPSPESYRRW